MEVKDLNLEKSIAFKEQNNIKYTEEEQIYQTKMAGNSPYSFSIKYTDSSLKTCLLNHKDEYANELKVIENMNELLRYKVDNHFSKEKIEQNSRILIAFMMYYIMTGYAPDPECRDNKILPPVIRNIFTYKDNIKTEKKLAESYSRVNFTNEKLRFFLELFNELPLTMKNHIVKMFPVNKMLRFIEVVFAKTSYLNLSILSKQDRAFINFIILAKYNNRLIYNLSAHRHHPDYYQTKYFYKHLAILIAFMIGGGSIPEYKTKYEEICSKFSIFDFSSINQLSYLIDHPTSFNNPNNMLPLKPNDQILSDSEIQFWLKSFIYQKNQSAPYYNDLSRGSKISMEVILKGLGLNVKGMQVNKNYEDWNKLKEENKVLYENQLKIAKETHGDVPFNKADYEELIDQLSKLTFSKDDLILVYLDFNIDQIHRDIHLHNINKMYNKE